MTTTQYAVIRYSDETVLGHVDLTAEQHAHYLSMAGDQGLIRLADLPDDYYDLDGAFQDTSPDTVVYLW